MTAAPDRPRGAFGAALSCRFLVLMLCSLVVAGCEALRPIDPMTETRFSAGSDGRTFSYVGYAEGPYALRTKEAERIVILERWLSQSQLCSAGYKITAQRSEKRPTGAFNVYYTGTCN
jgi:hypothetical protein